MRPKTAKTPLFAFLQAAMQQALSDDTAIEEKLSKHLDNTLSRRTFLKYSMGAGTAVVGGKLLTNFPELAYGKSKPSVVIVGAGIAGLHAAYLLRKAGIRATIYEASSRIGGRIYTAHDIMAPGLWTELGGEFIDSTHKDMLRLQKELGLERIDVENPEERHLQRHAYFFNGAHHTEKEIIEAFREIAPRIKVDIDSLPEILTYKTATPSVTQLDTLTLAGYLDKLGITGWLRSMLEVAYVTEYGLDSGEQSALNLIALISPETSHGFKLFGKSDERYKIKGGNSAIPDALGKKLEEQIQLDHTLEHVASSGSGFSLTFTTKCGTSKTVNADVVILTIPFTVLRNIKVDVEMPIVKTQSIQQLGYGTNSKVMMGFTKRVWRDYRYSGYSFTDEYFQTGWDNSELEPGTNGGFTVLFGGERGVKSNEGTAEDQAQKIMPGLEKAYPGAASHYNNNTSRFHWPSNPYTLGSYACYKPGQYSTIAGAEFEPVGNLYFAGEHCSTEFQGFMNGAAETGRRVAENILQKVLK